MGHDSYEIIENPPELFAREVVAGSACAYFSHTPEFLRFCQAAYPRCRGSSLGFVFADGQRVYVPLLAWQEARGWRARYESMFRAYGGPIADGPIRAERLQQVLDALAGWCGRHKILSLQVTTTPATCGWKPAAPGGHGLRGNVLDAETQVVALHTTAEELVKQFSPARRRHIKRAESQGVDVGVAASEADFREFLAVHEDRVKRWGENARARFSLGFFLALWRATQTTDDMKLWVARCEGRIFAGAVVLYHGPRAVYWLGASLADDSKRPNAYLHYRVMRDALARGYQAYDMGRSRSEGVKAFKTQYAAVSQPYYIITVDNVWASRIVGLGSRVWRALRGSRT